MRHGSYDKLDDDGLAPPVSINFENILNMSISKICTKCSNLFLGNRAPECLVRMLLLERPLLYLRRKLKDKLLVTQNVITA
jgi:hypothetical protein